MANKPYAASCEHNKTPIFKTIKPLLKHCRHVLEIGSGTGQHAVYFAKQMPHLIWQTSDVAKNNQGIKYWLDEAKLKNTPKPIVLNVSNLPWLDDGKNFDAIFSANTLHIMSFASVFDFFVGASTVLAKGGLLLVYGAFNYAGQYTSPSNQTFDAWLKARDPLSGIRDFEAVNKLAEENNFLLKSDNEMPANNRLLYWQKV